LASEASASLRHKIGAVGQHELPSAAEAARRAGECQPARDPGLDPGGPSRAARGVRRDGIYSRDGLATVVLLGRE
jgi:hypothetical protein